MASGDSEYKQRQDALLKSFEEIGPNLARLTQILKGDTETPGVVGRVAAIEKTLNGSDKDLGVSMKVKIMWIAGAWLLAAASGALGYLLHPYLLKLGTLLK